MTISISPDPTTLPTDSIPLCDICDGILGSEVDRQSMANESAIRRATGLTVCQQCAGDEDDDFLTGGML